jgi:hypothetical protein
MLPCRSRVSVPWSTAGQRIAVADRAARVIHRNTSKSVAKALEQVPTTAHRANTAVHKTKSLLSQILPPVSSNSVADARGRKWKETLDKLSSETKSGDAARVIGMRMRASQ